jgi:hypothetical protein
MKKSITNLVIAVVAVAFVAALTGTAAFAFDVVQNQKPHTFLPIPVDTEGSPESPAGGSSVLIAGVITDLTTDSISIDGSSIRLDASSDLDAGLTVGTKVEVTAYQQPDGTYLAAEVCYESGTLIDSSDTGTTPSDDCLTDDCSDDLNHDCSIDDCADDLTHDCSIDNCADDINEDINEVNQEYNEEIADANGDAEEIADINQDFNEEISDINEDKSENETTSTHSKSTKNTSKPSNDDCKEDKSEDSDND